MDASLHFEEKVTIKIMTGTSQINSKESHNNFVTWKDDIYHIFQIAVVEFLLFLLMWKDDNKPILYIIISKIERRS